MGKAEQHFEEQQDGRQGVSGTALSPHAEASKMLEAALQQMDGIISGVKLEPDMSPPSSVSPSATLPASSASQGFETLGGGSLTVSEAVELLSAAAQRHMLSAEKPPPPAPNTRSFLLRWLSGTAELTTTTSEGGGNLVSELEERVLRLESEKESLRLQVSVLSEQIEAQTEKICELEKCLGESRRRATHYEDLLQREMLARSSLETQKLELLSSASEVRLHHAALERENLQLRERISALSSASGRHKRVNDEEELERVRHGREEKEDVVTTSTPMSHPQMRVIENGTIENFAHHPQFGNSPSPSPISSSVSTVGRGGSPHRMMMGGYPGIIVDDGHEQRDPPPPAPRTPPASYRRKVEHIQFGGTLPRQRETLEPLLHTSEDPSVLGGGGDLLRHSRKGVAFGRDVPHTTSSSYSQSQVTHKINTHPYYSMSSISISSMASNPTYHTYQQHHPIVLQQIRANTADYGRKVRQCPGSDSVGEMASAVSKNARPTGVRSCSAPNLAETEKIIEDKGSNGYLDNEDGIEHEGNGNELSPQASPLLQGSKPKGIKKIFGKLKRSGSGNLEDFPEGDFLRGGVRSTAGPRLGWTKDNNVAPKQDSEAPFGTWDVNEVCTWLENLGLGEHEADARKWGATGAKLLDAHQSDFEKEMGIKNPLHKKKLNLAIIARRGSDYPGWDPGLGAADQAERDQRSPSFGGAGILSNSGGWILRWLDDVGLPQYKECFSASYMDARLLHRMTVEEATTLLHITSMLHLASLRRGIQVLRDNSFDTSCLIRRSVPSEDIVKVDREVGGGGEGDDSKSSISLINPSEVALWTNHRVMEWLRAVDLAEYAPNLRGSGVHGALMVYEPRFTADLLATLLSIPPSKTLLRRHLSTHFKDLVGRNVIGEKREAEAAPGYIPLTATSKVKVVKKSQFTLKRKKSRTDFDFEDLVCPLKNGRDNSPASSKPSGDKAIGIGDNLDRKAVQGVEDVSQEKSNKFMGLLFNEHSNRLERTSNV